MSNNRIILFEVFGAESIVTRTAARTLLDIISRIQDSNVFVDFEQIKFASRSFFDELYSFKNKFQLLGKHIEFVNMPDSLLQLANIVENTNSTRNNSFYSSIANAQVINI